MKSVGTQLHSSGGDVGPGGAFSGIRRLGRAFSA